MGARLDDFFLPNSDVQKSLFFYVPSHTARIKAVAFGPENFMMQGKDISDADFCPPIDYGLLTPEEKEQVKELLSIGVVSLGDVINFEGVSAAAGGGAIENTIIENTLLIEETTTEATITEATTTEITTIEEATTTIAEPPAEETTENSPAEENIPVVEEQPVVVPEETAVVEESIAENPAPAPETGNENSVDTTNE